MDILSLRLFLRVADLGVLSAAARDLSLSPASASARLAKLEETTGFRLFNRTTRSVSLTTDGSAFLPYAQQAIETLDFGLSSVGGQNTTPKGLLRMAMPGSFGRMHIIPILTEFKAHYPLITLDLRLSDEILDAVEGAYDLIIRNAHLPDSSLIARKLATDHRIIVASPEYLEIHGSPFLPDDLMQHQCINLGDNNKWKFENGQIIHSPRSFTVNDGEAMRCMIENSMGIGIKSVWNAYESIQSGKLIEVLPNHTLITESSIWALYPNNRMVAPKVRVMIDFLVARFQSNAPWEKAKTTT